MNCVWVAGTCCFLTVVVMLALLPCLVPAPLNDSDGRPRVANAAVVEPVRVKDVTWETRAQGKAVPVSMTFVVDEPHEVGRLFVNAEGKLEFQGDAEASAKAFLDALAKEIEK